MSSYSVEAENLVVKFGDFTAVNNVTFSVNRGEIFGFLGANGAGKTTTIRVLCGLLVPTSGNVHITGSTYDQGEDFIKSKVGYMSQKFTLYNDLTIEENFAFAAALRKIPKQKFSHRVQELIQFINLTKPLNTLVKDLAGGVKQQVSLATSILHDPEVIFLDEPTAGVTPASRARFWSLIRNLASQGKTVFVTTHYMDEAEQCGRIALMRAGEIIALDTPANLKQNTFPMPIYEVDPLKKEFHEKIKDLEVGAGLQSLESYGFKYHAIVQDLNLWEQKSSQYTEFFKFRQIPPTLEDVFIRLVEGVNR